MKSALLIFIVLVAGILLTAVAQVPQGAQVQRTSLTIYRDTPDGKKPDFVITGTSATNVNAQNVVNEFEMKSFRNGDPKQIQIIAQAPECAVDMSKNVASDPGPVQIFTPPTNQFVEGVGFRLRTNLFVKGVGFLFTQSNHFLIISNKVETRVIKSLLKSSVLGAPRTNAPANASEIFIYANHGEFNIDSNVVDYAGDVHMIDPELDLTCDLMTIRFTTNGVVESILALHNVVLTTTNNGRATGSTGFYYVTNGNEMMQLTTNAKWRNGDQAADAQDFTYDSTRHFLTGLGDVRVKWPNAEQKPPGSPASAAPTQTGTNGFRELYADFATMQFPPTNGPVESMHAHGHVIIVNQADQSSAMSDRAEYERVTDRVELTGSPIWWNTNMEVKGETLTAELGEKTYHARGNAHFKMRTGGSGTNQATVSGHATNQWVFISSDDMQYQTNKAIFYRNVETRLVENDLLRDKLNCALLTINLISNKVESAFASGNVHGETSPDTAGVIKTIVCEQLNAYLSITTGWMKTVDAYTNVIIEEKGTALGAPRNKLAADTVTAHFSAITNQIESAVAEHNVVLDQLKAGQNTHATSDHAVYTAGTNDLVTLTGTPLASHGSYLITNSDYMVWQPKANTFQAVGLYTIVPIKPAAGQKSP